MTRVIHTGDTHLGYQQYHSPERRRDFLEAFEQVIDDAVADDVDAVIHAGDLFHDRRPELRDLLGTIRVLRRLRDAGVPFLAVVGNHEATRGGQWLDLFQSLDLAERLGDEPRVVGDTAFYGLDHVPESRRGDLAYDFEPHDAAYTALVSHGLFTPFAHANWETETVLDRSNVDFDAVLLGDNHAPGTEIVEGTWVTYCGSTERASAAEEDPRGYNLVTFGGADAAEADAESAEPDDGASAAVDVRRRTLETRPFVFVSVELREGEGSERVHEQLRQREVDDAVVVVEVTGDGDPVTPASIEESLTERGALVARVTDRRETAAETSIDVSFADPDAAVDERVRDLGLSAAALDVEETIRAEGIADSNVREAVESRVTSLLEEGSGAFAPAEREDGGAPDPDDPGADDEGGSAEANDEGAAEANEEGAAAEADADPVSADDGSAAGSDDDGTAGSDDDGTAGSDDEGTAGSDDESASGEGTAAEPDAEESSTTDTQVTMEDF